MGSSYRSDLMNGRMPDWESQLRQAISLIESVESEVHDCIGDNGQYDDAAEDGELRETLWRAKEAILSVIPPTEKERAEQIERLERQLAFLKSSAGSLNS